MIWSFSVTVTSTSSSSSVASIRIAVILLRLHHVLRGIVGIHMWGAARATGWPSGVTSRVAIKRLLRLRIVIKVRMRRAHIVAHVVSTATSTCVRSSTHSRILFSPRALDRGSSDVSAIDGNDGWASRLFVVESDKSVTFVAEVTNFQDSSVGWKSRTNGVFVGVGHSATVHRKVHSWGLLKHFLVI